MSSDLCRSWVLDSGAFSAATSGTEINLSKFIEDAKRLQAEDKLLEAIFALDVIGDAESSLRNAEVMCSAGIDAIPTWHAGSDLLYLRHIAKEYRRIAIGGFAMRQPSGNSLAMSRSERWQWLDRVFSEVWPKWIHCFGVSGSADLNRYLFASVDSTTWTLRPGKYGSWKHFGGWLPVRLQPSEMQKALRLEVQWFLKEEERLSAIWRKEHEMIEANFAIRLACDGQALKVLRKIIIERGGF